MDKKVYEAVKERANGYCENCLKYCENDGHLHHSISGNGKRKQHESVNTCFWICQECHKMLHHDRLLEEKFKLMAQINVFTGYLNELQIEEAREKLGGKLYA